MNPFPSQLVELIVHNRLIVLQQHQIVGCCLIFSLYLFVCFVFYALICWRQYVQREKHCAFPSSLLLFNQNFVYFSLLVFYTLLMGTFFGGGTLSGGLSIPPVD